MGAKFSLTVGGLRWGEMLKLKLSYHSEGCMRSMQYNVEFLGTNSAFALGPRKTTKNLGQVGRSQDLLTGEGYGSKAYRSNPTKKRTC
jgi:hypothetical protein